MEKIAFFYFSILRYLVSGGGQQLHSLSSPGERNGKFSQNGKLGHSCTSAHAGDYKSTFSAVLTV